MKITYTSVREPRWANDEKTAIDCHVKFDHVKMEVPFTATSFDCEEHGREIFRKAAQGEFGEIAPKLEKPTTMTQIVPNLKNTGIPGWPELGQFLAEANSENSKGTNRGIVLVWSSMIEKLLGNLLEAFFTDHSISRELIWDSGEITFSAYIQLAFALGCISKDEFNICNNIRKIRNEFAHEWNATFENAEFKKETIPVFKKIYDYYGAETFYFTEELDWLCKLYSGTCGKVALTLANRIADTRHQAIRETAKM